MSMHRHHALEMILKMIFSERPAAYGMSNVDFSHLSS